MKLFSQLLFSSGVNHLTLCSVNSSFVGRIVSVSVCGLRCSVFDGSTRYRLFTNCCAKDNKFQLNSPCQANRLVSSRIPFTPVCRSYATGDEKNNDVAQSELKGVVVHLPNPVLWMKNKWYSYLIRFTVDPAFNLEEFLTGAKQALSFLTRLIVQKDFETLKSIASVEAVETVNRLITPWSIEQQHSVEVLVEDISLASASIAALSSQKDEHKVLVDVLCIAIKRYKSRPLMIQMTVRFQRNYSKLTTSEWFIMNINEFVVREMNATKASDQQPK